MKKILLPLIAVCCLAPAAVFAAQQHPLVTDMAETVAPSKVEAETAVEYFTADHAKEFVLQETITAGIAPKIDAFIAVPFKSIKIDGRDRENGIGDVVLGAKWNFAHVDKTALAVKPFLTLPTGDEDKETGKGGVGFGAVVVASLELDKHLAVDANLSLKHQGADVKENYNEVGVSVAGKFEATKQLKVVGELATAKTDKDGAEWEANLTAGVIFEAQKNLDLDLGVRFGLTDEMPDFGVLAGVTFKF